MCNAYSGTVSKVPRGGSVVINLAVVSGCQGIAVNSSGSLFVGSNGGNAVYTVNTLSGQITLFASSGLN